MIGTGLNIWQTAILGGDLAVSIAFNTVLSVIDNAAASTVISQASVNGKNGPYNFTLTDDAGGQFAITTAGELTVGLVSLTPGLQSVTVREDSGAGDPIVSTRAISVMALPVNTVPPVFSGTPEIDQIGSTTEGTWSGFPVPTLTFQAERDGVDISGAELRTYLFSAQDNETSVNITVTATNSIGSVSIDSNALSITYAAPLSAGALTDRSFTDNTGVETVDASGDFTGSDLTFSLVTSTTGVTINSGTGIVSLDTDILAVQAATAVVVRATNSGGNDDSGFNFTIAEVVPDAPVFNGPLNAQSYTEDTGNQTFDLSGGFVGESIVYSIISAPTGLTINSGTGVVTTNTVTAEIQSSTTVTVRATNGGGSDDGTFSLTVLLAAPTLTGALANQTFSDDTGNQTYDASVGFDGNSLIYSLISPPTGVTIASGTGVITFNTDTLSVQTDTAITVRATNATNSVDGSFLLTNSEVLNPPVATGAISDVALTVDDTANIDAGADFTGATSYTLAPTSAALPNGTSLNSSTGVITGTVTTVTSARAIIIRGSNGDGFDDSAFNFSVAAAGPALSAPNTSGTTNYGSSTRSFNVLASVTGGSTPYTVTDVGFSGSLVASDGATNAEPNEATTQTVSATGANGSVIITGVS